MQTEADAELEFRTRLPVLDDVFETTDYRLGHYLGRAYRGAYSRPDNGHFIDTYTPTFRTADGVHAWFAEHFDRLAQAEA